MHGAREYGLPVHVECSINEFIKIIDIVESNIFLHKDVIYRELEVFFGTGLPAIRRKFKLYCPYNITLDVYISRRKYSEAIKKIRSLKCRSVMNVNLNIMQMCQCSKSYFNRMIYKEFGVRVDDFIDNPSLDICMLDKIDGDEIKLIISFIVDSIVEFNEEGVINSSICKTKLYIKNDDILPSMT